MEFTKSKTFKILNIISFVVLVLIITLNLIASFADLSKNALITFIVIICVGAIYVIGFNIVSIVLVSKYNKREKNEKK